VTYSVVIPAYNAADTIQAAVGSVLGQTRPPESILVVDDGSTDRTATVVAAMAGPVTVIRQANAGPGAATTAGLERVRTPFVAMLDADDLWLPGKAARQLARFAEEPDVAGVFTLARLFADGHAPDPDRAGPVRRLWTRTTLMFRTRAARDVGAVVDLPGRIGEMVDWLARSRDLGHRHAMLEEVLALRRVRPGSLSYALDAERSRGYLVAAHAALQRRRRRAVAREPASDA
jgi:glycosyltransferase involved in cell wall biosynthesis